MKIKYSLNIILVFVAFFTVTSYSQVAINSDGSAPDGSSMLDISSTSSGMLIPRMLTTERTAIVSPVQGLMVYQTDNTEGFYYYNGSSWLYIGNEDNNLWTRDADNNYTNLSNSGDNVGIGTSAPNAKLSVNGYATATNYVSVIPLWQAGSVYSMSNTSGADLSNCEAGFEPSVYEASGNVEVKLVIRITSSSTETTEFQLRVHDGSNESYPIIFSDSWTWANTQNGYVVTSSWKIWNAGTNAHEIHLWGKVISGTTEFNSAYLLVRPAQP